MLRSIDVLIGLVVVLLALSMAVTMITQSLTTILNSRGRHLRRGLVDLLQQLDPSLTETVSRAVATRLLTHPLVSGSNTPLSAFLSGLTGGPRLGNVVHREEFTKLLMHLATDRGTASLDTQVIGVLKTALSNNGIADPEAALKAVRTTALRLEEAHPELAHGARQNIAILQEAKSDFVAKINNWFDQTMDRTSQRFTASTRAITFAGAFIVAFGLQVDTLALANRLAADDKLRDAFVSQAVALDKANTAPGEANAAAGAASDDAMSRRYLAFLAQNGIVRLPGASLGEWRSGFRTANYFGLIITALLLSLGAPFWYGALSKLLQLRSALAAKDDVQRETRQTNQASGGQVLELPTATTP